MGRKRIYYVELPGRCGLIPSTSAKAAINEAVEDMLSPKARIATKRDIEAVRSMGGFVPEKEDLK